MLYQFIDDNLDQQRGLLNTDKNMKTNRKRKRPIRLDETNPVISQNFVFELNVEEAHNEINADLDGLKKFLMQKSGKNILDSKLSEMIDNERKLLKNNSILNFNDVDYTCNEEKILESIFPNKNDKLRLKSQKKKKREKNSKNFFDNNSQQIIDASSGLTLSFEDFGLSKSLLKAIFEAGFHQPTTIQTACIPVALAGRDICACSSTGTGKTAAFIIPILERLLYKPRAQKSVTKVLILVPTRELAIQVFQVSRRLAKYTSIEICLAAGGLDVKTQEAALRNRLDIVIATPGRLIDHLYNSPNFLLRDIEVLVIDEADRMLEEEFKDQMREIINLCAKNRQTLLFSATMTEEVEDLVELTLIKPVKLFLDENTDIAKNLKQEFIRIRAGNEVERQKRKAIIAALVTRSFTERTIIFSRTKEDCIRMNVLLGLLGVKIGQLHGGITQVQRVENLYAFKQQKDIKILCATELAARGLDIEGVTTVINMHMPKTLKQYIHRVGRTARAGMTGRSISLIGERDRKLLKEIMKMNKKNENSPMQRTIHSGIIDAYQKQIVQLEPIIEKLLAKNN